MAKESPKLRSSAWGRFAALLAGADAALVGLIISSTVYGSALWSWIFAATACLLFAIVIGILVQLARQGRSEEVVRSLGRAAWLMCSSIFWAVAAGLVILAAGYGLTIAMPEMAPLLLYGLAFTTILVMSWSGARSAIRRRRMLLILNRLDTAVRLGLPLPRTMLDAAQSETGVMRLRLMALYDHLDRGEPLDRALLLAVPEVPYSVVRMIAAGQEMGCLGHVLETIIRRKSQVSQASNRNASFYWAYPVLMFAVISLIMIVVVPKYLSMFRDFHIELPPVTRALLSATQDYDLMWPIVLVLTLIPLGQALARLFPSFRRISPFGGMVTDHLAWWTPVLGGYVSDRGMAELCDLVAAGVRMGHPFDEALAEAASAQPNAVMRYRTAAWAEAVSEGRTMHEAARYARMPELFASMLATVRNNDSLLDVLGFLWRYYEYRVNRARAVLQAMYLPVIVIVFGAIVAVVGSALMQPLAMLSEHLSYQISGGF